MNAPISDTLALRAAFTTSVHEGYISNGTDDEDVKSGRIRALWQPSEKLSFLLTGEVKKSNDYGVGGVDDFIKQSDRSNPWVSSQTNTGNSMRQTTKRAYSNIDMDFGPFTSSLVFSINKVGSGGTSTGIPPGRTTTVTSINSHTVNEKSAEARFVSSEDFPFKWILGLVYYKASDEEHSKDDTGGYRDKSAEQGTRAVYGNVTYPVTDAFRVTGGLRYTDDKNSALAEMYPGRSGGIDHEIYDMPYNHPDYKVGMEYDLERRAVGPGYDYL